MGSGVGKFSLEGAKVGTADGAKYERGIDISKDELPALNIAVIPATLQMPALLANAIV